MPEQTEPAAYPHWSHADDGMATRLDGQRVVVRLFMDTGGNAHYEAVVHGAAGETRTHRFEPFSIREDDLGRIRTEWGRMAASLPETLMENLL